MSTKKCCKCELEKPLEDFYKRGNGYKSNCKKCTSVYGKKYYSLNKERHNQQMSKHYLNNVEKYVLRHKKYREKNKDKINNIAKNYLKKRRKEDILFKLKHNLRVRIKEFMKSKNMKSTNRTFEFVGCTPETLRKHLENNFMEGMSWENYGKWEIDHKIPLSMATSIDELYKLNYYLNLQPMWEHENIKKGAQLYF
jgi:hypothetical protein